jgi:hypothetical protein
MAKGELRKLKALREAHEKAGADLQAAEDRLGRARDGAREAIKALAGLEVRAVTEPIEADELAAARTVRQEATAHLDAVETELRDAKPG